MPTDTNRVRRTDPGDPGRCPVWALHGVYSNDDTRNWVLEGCKSAGIGCIECKQPIIDAVLNELKPIQERARQYEENRDLVKKVLSDGAEKAREVARETLNEVRSAMGLTYR